MAGEQKIENAEPDHNGGKPDSFTNAAEGYAASGEDGLPSESTSAIPVSGGATSSSKGSNGVFPQFDDHGYCHTDASPPGIQSDNGSLVYDMPRYNKHIRESFMGVDGQCHKPYSSGYPKPTVETSPNAKFRANGWNSLNSNDSLAGESSALALSSNSHQYPASSNFSKSGFHQRHKQLNKLQILASEYAKTVTGHRQSSGVSYVGPNFKSVGPAKGLQPVGSFSSFNNRRQGVFQDNGPMNYRPDNRIGYGSNRYKVSEKSFRNEGSDATGELTRGPRAQKISTANPSIGKEVLGINVRRDRYNQTDFQIQYEMAKFYMIKSYNEDDIHKCIKYNVWASTPNGNKKLDASFHEAEAKATEKGLKCPIFLFFSVNGSGQFVGLAEMVGQVDFNKDLDFWQQDKWNGFFPVKWNIIKDIPNAQLRDIVLENNENKAVTHSRDTQEIPLKQGLKMLGIFKNHIAKTSILDDFDFYENREKLLHAKRSKHKFPRGEIYSGVDSLKHSKGERRVGEGSLRAKKLTDPTPSLINLTENLSLDDHRPNTFAVPEPEVQSMSFVSQ